MSKISSAPESKRFLVLISFFLIFLFLSNISNAQDRSSSVKLGLSSGILYSDELSDTLFGGYDLGMNLSKYVFLDLSVLNALSISNSSFITLGSSFYIFPMKRFSPFITLGGGVGVIERGNSAGTKGFLNAGVGINYFLSKDMAFRLDLRDYVIGSSYNNWATSAGIVFYFETADDRVVKQEVLQARQQVARAEQERPLIEVRTKEEAPESLAKAGVSSVVQQEKTVEAPVLGLLEKSGQEGVREEPPSPSLFAEKRDRLEGRVVEKDKEVLSERVLKKEESTDIGTRLEEYKGPDRESGLKPLSPVSPGEKPVVKKQEGLLKEKAGAPSVIQETEKDSSVETRPLGTEAEKKELKTAKEVSLSQDKKKEVPDTPVPGRERITIKNNRVEVVIEFNVEETSISTENEKLLDEFVATLKDMKPRKILIEGHACAHGDRRLNLLISKERALSVKRFFEKHGISKNISVRYYGEERLRFKEIPTPDNVNDPHVKANRRVRIVAYR